MLRNTVRIAVGYKRGPTTGVIPGKTQLGEYPSTLGLVGYETLEWDTLDFRYPGMTK